MSCNKKWQKYPDVMPKPKNDSSHSSALCWITVENTDGEHIGERVVSITRLINIDLPGYQTLWEYWCSNTLVDHWGLGRKVIAWKPFDIPEPYDM